MSGKDRGDKDAPSLEPPTLFGRKRRRPVVEQAAAGATRVDVPAVRPDDQPTAAVEPVTESVVEPVVEPVVDRRPAADPPAPPLFVDEALQQPPSRPEPAPLLVDQQATAEPSSAPRSTGPAEPRAPREPFVTGMPAACLTGALVGLATVGLTWLGLRACEVTRGTSSCGNPGFLLLLAILAAMVLAGSALLRTFRVAEPRSTSLLAVGLLSVLVLLFLIDALFSWTMVIVIPLLAVGCFAASHWVTTMVADADA